MNDMIPAQPHTYLLRADPENPKAAINAIPVVGWRSSGKSLVHAVYPCPVEPLAPGCVFVVRNPTDDTILTLFDPILRRTTLHPGMSLDHVRSYIGQNHADLPEEGEVENPAEGIVVDFNHDKTFKRDSFWVFKDAGREFVFQVPAGEALPDDGRVEKTNRDGFREMKRSLSVAEYEDLRAASDAYDPGEEEPETEEDDDDDFGDLI